MGPHKPVLLVLFALYCCGKMLSKSDLGKPSLFYCCDKDYDQQQNEEKGAYLAYIYQFIEAIKQEMKKKPQRNVAY